MEVRNVIFVLAIVTINLSLAEKDDFAQQKVLNDTQSKQLKPDSSQELKRPKLLKPPTSLPRSLNNGPQASHQPQPKSIQKPQPKSQPQPTLTSQVKPKSILQARAPRTVDKPWQQHWLRVPALPIHIWIPPNSLRVSALPIPIWIPPNSRRVPALPIPIWKPPKPRRVPALPIPLWIPPNSEKHKSQQSNRRRPRPRPERPGRPGRPKARPSSKPDRLALSQPLLVMPIVRELPPERPKDRKGAGHWPPSVWMRQPGSRPIDMP